ncbi:Heavy metal-associated domain, HMA [Sesbania bispinosa]|nr:Heavy metal-associated domain, HMA [Sesbania bispinosa]
MDAKPAQAAASEPLKYQTWFLKVSIHCEGCRRKVKKVLKNIDGVFTATIDPQQQKVTVTGSVGVETLLRKLVRAGKHAEIWPENLDGKGKSSVKAKKNDNGTREPQSLENKGTENAAKCENESKRSNSKTGDGSPEKSPAGDKVLPEGGQSDGGGGGSGKKKKKKGQSGGNGSNGVSSASTSGPAHSGFQLQNPGQVVGQQLGQVNLSPTRQQSFSYPETGYPPMVYVTAYNRLYPMGRNGGPCYYVPPSPYMCAGLDHDGTYQFQSAPLVSFEIFSDENANGCSIM